MVVDRPMPHRASIKDEQGADTEYKDSANGQTIHRIQALNEEVSYSTLSCFFIFHLIIECTNDSVIGVDDCKCRKLQLRDVNM